MALQLSTAVRNAMLDQLETTIGSTSLTIEMRTGAPPANAAAADSGTVVATITLPADWLAAAASGAKAIAGGPWTDTVADNTGIIAHFRLKQSTTCHIQGTVTETGGGGDMIIDNNDVNAGQPVSITAFTLTAGGA
jgi:hypothetical protein